MVWTSAHCAYAVEMFFKTGKSVIATHRAFCTHFMLRWNDAVTDWKLILLWGENFRPAGSALKRRPWSFGWWKTLEIAYNGVWRIEATIFKIKWIQTVAICLNSEIIFLIAFTLVTLSTFKMSETFLPHTICFEWSWLLFLPGVNIFWIAWVQFTV